MNSLNCADQCGGNVRSPGRDNGKKKINVVIRAHGLVIRSQGLVIRSHGLGIRSHGLGIRSHGLGIRSHCLTIRHTARVTHDRTLVDSRWRRAMEVVVITIQQFL